MDSYNSWSVVYGETPSATKWNYLGTNDSRFNEILTNAATGWINPEETWTYASASTFTVSGNLTEKYKKGTRLKWTQTSVKYGVVINSSYSSPNTTVTIATNTDYTIANATISDNFYSYGNTPQGFPDSFNWSPSYGGIFSMTYTSVTTRVAKFNIIGKYVFFYVAATGTIGGSPSQAVTVSLPATSSLGQSHNAGGAIINPGGTIVPGCWQLESTTLISVYYGSNWSAGTNRTLAASGFYELA